MPLQTFVDKTEQGDEAADPEEDAEADGEDLEDGHLGDDLDPRPVLGEL